MSSSNNSQSPYHHRILCRLFPHHCADDHLYIRDPAAYRKLQDDRRAAHHKRNEERLHRLHAISESRNDTNFARINRYVNPRTEPLWQEKGFPDNAKQWTEAQRFEWLIHALQSKPYGFYSGGVIHQVWLPWEDSSRTKGVSLMTAFRRRRATF